MFCTIADGPRALRVTPRQPSYPPGSKIEVSADRSPSSRYKWVDTTTNKTVVTGRILTITDDMLSIRSLKVVAYNNICYMNTSAPSATRTHQPPVLHEHISHQCYMNTSATSATRTHQPPVLHEHVSHQRYTNTSATSATRTHQPPVLHEHISHQCYTNTSATSATRTHQPPVLHEHISHQCYTNTSATSAT